MVRGRLAAAHGLAPERIEIRTIRTTGDAIRDRPLSEARRQGAVHQGDRGGARGRRRRPRGAFGQGHADGAAGRPDHRGGAAARGSARRLHQPQGEVAAGAAGGRRGRHRVAAAAGAGEAAAARSRRSCRSAAMSRRGCASSMPARSMRRCSRSPASSGSASPTRRPKRSTADEFIPAVGQGIIAIEARADDAATRDLLAAIDHADSMTALVTRARVPRGARRLLPHADRRPCDDRERPRALSRPDREAGRQRLLRRRARGRRRAMPPRSAPMPARS